MSVGGGFKKGKAEFAVKDVNGKPITIATDKFYKNEDDNDILDIYGIDIGDSTYGLYFKSPSQNSVASIYINEGALAIDAASTNTSMVKINCDLSINGEVYADNIDGKFTHCWLIRGGNYKFYIYTTSPVDDFYNGISDIFGNDSQNLINFKGSFSTPKSNYYPIQYLQYTFIGSESKYNLTFKCLVIGTNGTVTTENVDISVTSTSQQQGSIAKKF